MNPRLHSVDQVELVRAAMDLPDGERHKADHEQDRSDIEGDQRRDALAR